MNWIQKVSFKMWRIRKNREYRRNMRKPMRLNVYTIDSGVEKHEDYTRADVVRDLEHMLQTDLFVSEKVHVQYDFSHDGTVCNVFLNLVD